MAPDNVRRWLTSRAGVHARTDAGISDSLIALHERLLEGDPSTCEEIAARMLSALRGRLIPHNKMLWAPEGERRILLSSGAGRRPL